MFPAPLIKFCHGLLNEGAARLDMPIGIVSRVYNDLYQVVAINSASGPLVEGACFPIQATYCRDVIKSGKTLAITEIDGMPGMRRHPLYVKMPLEAYISAPIFHDGEPWGTVNFTSINIRAPFSPEEIRLVEGYAAKIAEKLGEMDHSPNL
jgi:GAF domain-containing protein